MPSPIRSGKKWNAVGYRSSSDLNLASGGVVTGSNTNRVFRANGDGTWSSYRPSRTINGFTTMTRARTGTQEVAANGSGNVYLLDASANFNVTEQIPIATVLEGSSSTPSENADDATYIHTISGFDRIPNYALLHSSTGTGTGTWSGGVIRSNGTGGGDWSAGATWSGGVAPGNSDIVRIDRGDTVTVDGEIPDDFLVVSVENGGTLEFDPTVDTELRVQTIQVRETGTLTMGTPGAPVSNGTTCRLVILDAAVDTAFDPNQYGNGLVVLGSLTMCGYDRGKRFYRSSHERSAGATSITLAEAAANWQVGDDLFIPDTRQPLFTTRAGWTTQSLWVAAAQWEYRTLSSKSGGDLTLNLSSALSYDHAGPRNDAGSLETGMLWHVFNRTSNVTIESENPAGTRGHCLFTSHARIDIRNARFFNLGRTTAATLDNTTFDGGGSVTHVGTNQIGRYPAHFHHCGGREPISYDGHDHQFLFLNNVVDQGTGEHTFKWGVTVHGTHWGLVRNNLCHNTFSGFVLEDGTETMNWVEGNASVRTPGNNALESSDDAATGFARNGAAFWSRSGLSKFSGNVACNCYGYGFIVHAIYISTVTLPVYPGQHMHSGSVSGGASAPGNKLGLWDCSGWEIYGQGAGITLWWVGSVDAAPEYSTHRSVIGPSKFWHLVTYCVYLYPTCNVTLDGWVARYDTYHLNTGEAEASVAIWPGDYMQCNHTTKNADISGCYDGLFACPFSEGYNQFLNCKVRAAHGVRVDTPGAPGSAPNGVYMKPRITHVEGCDLTPTSATVALGSKYEVHLHYNLHGGVANLAVQNDVYVYDRSGSDYRLYFDEAAPSQTMLENSGARVGCPEAGLTNQQSHDKYQPYDPAVGASTPVKADNPNPATPGLCHGGTLTPAGTTSPSWTNADAEAI